MICPFGYAKHPLNKRKRNKTAAENIDLNLRLVKVIFALCLIIRYNWGSVGSVDSDV